MKVEVKRLDNANIEVNAEISKDILQKRIDDLAKKAGKNLNIAGFRKGKVPPSIVKKMYGKELEQDAESEIIKEVITNAYEEAKISPQDVIGDPLFKKYEKGDDKIEASIQICLKPKIELGDYSDIIPQYEKPTATEEEIEDTLKTVAKNLGELKEVDREVKEGDIVTIDFKGYIDNEPFEGGEAKDFELEIGSKSLIDGFEDQLIGMKKNETKRIKVTFPKDYQAKELAGKEAEFDVTIKNIKEKVPLEINDELAKKALKKDDATLDELKEQIKKDLEQQKLLQLYENELKPQILENLVKKYQFDLPENIVEQEIDNLATQKAQSLSKEELEKIQGNEEEINKLRESVREDATNSVKATFIVDALAKDQNIQVSDDEVAQVIYYEALINNYDPKELTKYYQKNNLIPALKMGMIEDKLFKKLLKINEQE
ncbi:MAG: trigger factor [Epsilonproteobacteria bacterium]|nr:trigger factor [Campylobacterota bacterium]